ncbi:protoporphyrinogen oxidase [Salisaeta longa]|uniref:protoporphyrinogen oxidase n=1 Tax=Salisaeta longa TaxID=503170 RepID=UPI0003B46A23|nr:protoporphyrinogen oxidase [Salisaeta longa]
MARIGIIGAGIAGLTAAYQLQQQGHMVRVWEARGVAGGAIRSERTSDGFLVEHGPNSLRATTPIVPRLLEDLGLERARLSAAPAATKRFIVRDGTLRPLPLSPPALLTTSLLSTRAKLRLLREPFVAAGAPTADETVASFVRRRLGPEVLAYAVDPFVAGIFAGDPHRLSLKHAFGRLYEMERTHGSLLRAALHSARTGATDDASTATDRRIFSLRDGLQMLPHALADALGEAIRYEAPVTALRQMPDGTWTVATETDATQVNALISTVPLHALGSIDWAPAVDTSPLQRVPYPPVRVVALGFRRADVAHPLDGFGMLVPSAEDQFQILGTLVSSTLFPGRAPAGHVLLTTFVGGMRHPTLGAASDAAVRKVVLNDLQALLGVQGAPVFERFIAWPRAIPQYTLNHGAAVRTLEQLEDVHPGLFFAGNYRDGISVGDAMASGEDAARRVDAHLAGADRAVAATGP